MSDLKQWQPEDDNFWQSTGKAIANRNLWISIPSLLCGFGVWMLWSIVTVQMLNVGYPFSTAELFTLTAIAGLTDVDAITLSMAEYGSQNADAISLAASAVVVAALSNTVVKCAMVFSLGGRALANKIVFASAVILLVGGLCVFV